MCGVQCVFECWEGADESTQDILTGPHPHTVGKKPNITIINLNFKSYFNFFFFFSIEIIHLS